MPKHVEGQPYRYKDPAAYAKMQREKQGDKLRAYHREYHAKHIRSDPAYAAMKHESAKWHRRKAKYGISREEFTKLLTEQEGRCSICNEVVGEALRVDHDHKTGKVRALLCGQCNSGLGLFREDPIRLQSAIEYVHRHRG